MKKLKKEPRTRCSVWSFKRNQFCRNKPVYPLANAYLCRKHAKEQAEAWLTDHGKKFMDVMEVLTGEAKAIK